MDKPPIISVVGPSNSGKTNLITRLVPELKCRGYKVATIKHDAHDFEIDHPGKDSWLHARAGADVVLISSPYKVALIEKVEAELQLEEVIKRILSPVDLIITEGYKREKYPKIEVFLPGRQAPSVSPPEELIAVVGEAPPLPVPRFSWDDMSLLADFIEERYLKGKPL
ncbi:MAG TPA: molybdopterin-guanine dinucleotide biosynthesis protein B [Moorella mulderi]|nr:molybdopterin-guanine dinucleotide biosynthesis protein B [Moorella mulderi]